MNQDLTSVIVPAWRGGDPPPVAALVRSLAETVTTPFEIVIVCNGQDAPLLDYLRHEPAVTRAAFLTGNVGVARGWNVGAHLALGEFLVFINEDLVVGPGCIDALVARLREDRSVGMAGPQGEAWEFAQDHARRLEFVPGDGTVECDVVSGFLFAMPRAALVEAGMFDDEYAPAGCEEVDIAQAVRRTGRRCIAVGGLAYEHDWGVSVWHPDRPIAWMGGAETTGAIHVRNMARLVRKWGSGPVRKPSPCAFSASGSVEPGDVGNWITEPRTVRGRVHRPFLQTMADVVEATKVVPRGGSILGIGGSIGLLVHELVSRGYNARGVELDRGRHAAATDGVRVVHSALLELPVNQRYDAVFADGVFEQLNDAEARLFIARILSVSDVLLAVIGKDRRKPTNVNIKSNRRWLQLFADGGLGFDALATTRGRWQYLRDDVGPEAWHVNLLVLSRRRTSAVRRAVTRVAGDGTLAWRVAGETAFPWW